MANCIAAIMHLMHQLQGIAGEQERLLACHGKMKSFIRNAYLLVYVEEGERRSAQSYPGLCAYGLLSGSDPV